MMLPKVIALIAVFIPTALTVQLGVKNLCSYPVWLITTPNTNYQPLNSVRVQPGSTYTYQIPSGGWAGRIWPKTGCDSSGNNCEFGQSVAPCPTGGCHPPADTKVEFNFPASNSNADSWYDISLVDGYSLPMSIEPRGVPSSGSCITTNCAMSLNDCPQNEIQGIGDLRVFKNGKVVACLSPCKKWNFPAPYGLGKPETITPGVNMCCPTPPISPQQCSSGIVIQTAFVRDVHKNCPSAYSYAYDDAGGLHNCPSQTSFDVTLCPGTSPPEVPDQPCTSYGWKFYDGYDIQGNDLFTTKTGDRNQCQGACNANSNCKAYSWFNGVCYHKSSGGPIIPASGVYSAVICSSTPQQPCTQWGWRFYDNYDIVNNDLFNSPAADRNTCQNVCRSNSSCKGYSWFNGVCYHKSGAGTIIPKANVYSATIC